MTSLYVQRKKALSIWILQNMQYVSDGVKLVLFILWYESGALVQWDGRTDGRGDGGRGGICPNAALFITNATLDLPGIEPGAMRWDIND